MASGDDPRVEAAARALWREIWTEADTYTFEASGRRDRCLMLAYQALAAADGVGTPEPSRDAIANALQAAWNDFCDDTGNFPDCFEWRGRKLYADFHRGNFARMVAGWLAQVDGQGTGKGDEK